MPKACKSPKRQPRQPSPWALAVGAARKKLGIRGFVLLRVGKDGEALYRAAKALCPGPGRCASLKRASPKRASPKRASPKKRRASSSSSKRASPSPKRSRFAGGGEGGGECM